MIPRCGKPSRLQIGLPMPSYCEMMTQPKAIARLLTNDAPILAPNVIVAYLDDRKKYGTYDAR